MAGIQELLEIMARLRDPERGCPWDLDQDFASISPHTIEEAYEVDEAIARGDLPALCDEVGDLLFQVVFQARLGEELGAFDFEQVVDAVCQKLVRRHPHIFADAPSPGTAAAQVASWEAIKSVERTQARRSEDGPPDPFEGIPRALPALMRSAKLVGRMASLSTSGGLGRSAEPEAEAEARAAACAGVARVSERAATAASGLERSERLALVGDGIRAWVELARQLGVDPEQALRQRDDAMIAAFRGDVHQGGSSRLR